MCAPPSTMLAPLVIHKEGHTAIEKLGWKCYITRAVNCLSSWLAVSQYSYISALTHILLYRQNAPAGGSDFKNKQPVDQLAVAFQEMAAKQK